MAMDKKLRRTVVAGSVVCGIGLVGAGVYPALASDRGPELPGISAEELLVKVAESDADQLSGTVRVDLGLNVPALGALGDNLDGPSARLASLATGNSTLRVAVDGPERQRIAIADGSEEFSVIHNAGDVWMYDSAGNTAYHAEIPEEELAEAAGEAAAEAERRHGAAGEFATLTPQELAQRFLAEADEHADITVDGTAKVAGQSAYQLVVTPHETVENGYAAVDSVRISVDAETGLPLAVTVQGPEGTIADVAFTHIRYEQPAGGSFYFTPPQGADVVDLNTENPLEGFGGGLLDH
ncbi:MULTISPECIES: sigma-E factor regulatory protein RseB domain-containing protein [unclassified Streptomyces]|uniref:LolA family protein n=1 Tax=unclassified Streptomyces TaxID=2593676 RepID=UPI0011B0008A|nr:MULTISPECIES: sigma-E factor regulatory protein RseB domain-containing protein [unclassified Streptomyces]